MGTVQLLSRAWERYISGWTELPDSLRHAITKDQQQETLLPSLLSEIYKPFSYFTPEQTKLVILVEGGPEILLSHEFWSAVYTSLQVPEQELIVASDWAAQGILLLTTQLSGAAEKTKAHAGLGWEKEIAKVLTKMSREIPSVGFLLLGGDSCGYKQFIEQSGNLVLESRTGESPNKWEALANSDIFGDASTFLERKERTPTPVWSRPAGPDIHLLPPRQQQAVMAVERGD